MQLREQLAISSALDISRKETWTHWSDAMVDPMDAWEIKVCATVWGIATICHFQVLVRVVRENW